MPVSCVMFRKLTASSCAEVERGDESTEMGHVVLGVSSWASVEKGLAGCLMQSVAGPPRSSLASCHGAVVSDEKCWHAFLAAYKTRGMEMPTGKEMVVLTWPWAVARVPEKRGSWEAGNRPEN